MLIDDLTAAVNRVVQEIKSDDVNLIRLTMLTNEKRKKATVRIKVEKQKKDRWRKEWQSYAVITVLGLAFLWGMFGMPGYRPTFIEKRQIRSENYVTNRYEFGEISLTNVSSAVTTGIFCSTNRTK